MNFTVNRIARRGLIAAIAATMALAAAPVFAAGTAAVAATDAWIRWLPANLPAGGYVSLRNDSGKTVELVGAESPDYGSTMLHKTIKKGGMMEMVPADKVAIPAHGSVAFQPGGLHIMFMQAKKEVKPGDKVPVTLKFADGQTLAVDFEVRKADAAGPGAGMGGMKMN